MTWQLAAEAAAVGPEGATIVQVGGKEIGLFQRDGRYYAVLNYCPHAGAPICRGRVSGAVISQAPGQADYDVENPVIRCPWHHWEFDLRSGASLCPIPSRLRTYEVRIEDGCIYIQM
jgi:nitrite reductase/ring-hydroxylating ferredoxin subunit